MASLLEITIQRRGKDGLWPVVAERHRPGTFPVRSEGQLQLADEPSEVLPRKYGTALGQALFRETIRDALVRALHEATDGFARVLLFVEDEYLWTWRWEWLCGPMAGDHWDFLSLHQRTPFSLYIPSLTDRDYPPIGRQDLHALAVVASPVDPDDRYEFAAFDVAQTVTRLRGIFGDSKVPLAVLAQVPEAAGTPTLDALVKRLTEGSGEGPYTILHLVCHGHVTREGETVLHLEDSSETRVRGEARAQSVTASELIERLARVRRLPYLVFLSACESSAPVQRLGGLAQRLVRELGIPAVIGMAERVTIKTAHALAEAFYRQFLAQGKIGEVDRALVEAYAGLAGRTDVNVPALYSRYGAQPLFSPALDRQLTFAQIRRGLETLGPLLVERAPVLETRFRDAVQKLQPLLNTNAEALSPAARQERGVELSKLDELCQEAAELSFHALAQGEKPPRYDGWRPDRRPPFQGLSAFRTEDQEFFFGREALVDKLLQKLTVDNFLPVLGSSGSGKSSLVLAGLVPQLKEQVPDLQVIEDLTPDRSPMERLRASQLKLVAKRPVLYIVDQFEELFTMCKDEGLRRAFIAELLELAKSDRVVLTMRADFWGECADYKDLKERMQARQELVAPMNAAELRTAMEQQAAKVGLRFEADLSNRMLDDVAGEPGAMPLLQHALFELWKRRHGRWLRASEYRALGGVKQAIAQTADRLYDGLPSPEQKRVRDIFVRLTHLGEDTVAGEEHRDTRHRVPLKELVPKDDDEEAVKVLVTQLADAVLVVTNWNAVSQQVEVEVAHEALIQHWGRLRDWIDADRVGLRTRAKLTEAAREWKLSARDDGFLYTGANLTLAEEWARLHTGALAADESEFLRRSLEMRRLRAAAELEAARKLAEEQRRRAELSERREKEQKEAARKLRRWTIGAGAAAATALILFTVSVILWHASVTARDEAVENARQAHVSLACNAYEAGKGAETLAHLAKALRLNPKNFGADAFTGSLIGSLLTQASWILPIYDPVWHKAILSASPDWDRMIIASDDRTLRLCETTAGAPIGQPMKLDGAVVFAQFSPDSQRIVTAAWDSTAQLWDAVTGQPIGQPMRHQQFIPSAQFSPDGQRVVTASADGTARLWDAITGKPIGELMRHSDVVESAQFSPDGQRVVTASADRTARLWDAVTGNSIGEPMRHSDKVESAQFSPDGQRIVTASADRTARLWDAVTGNPIGEPMRHSDKVESAQFSPDGQRVVTASEDGTARLWDAVTGNPIGEPMRHSDKVESAQFSPDGQRVITAAKDQTVRLWDAATGNPISKRLKYQGRVGSIQFRPDGQRVLITSAGFPAQLWDVTSRRATEEILKHGASISSAYFSADGRRVVTTCSDTARVWDTATGLMIGEPMRHDNSRVYSARLSPDSKRVVTASEDKTARLWDATTGKPLGQPLKHQDSVLDAEFSPDGRRVITVSTDNTARLWDPEIGIPISEPLKLRARVFPAQFSPDSRAQFSPDSRLAVTASWDGTARLWDTATGNAIGKPLKHDGTFLCAQFNRDGTRMMIVSIDSTSLKLSLWDTVTCTLTVSRELKARSGVSSLEFSPDLNRIVTCLFDNTARLWDTTTDMLVGEPLKHEGWVVSAQFSPNGRSVVTASKDHTARVWDAATGKPLSEPLKHQAEVFSARFSPDGQRLVTISGDNTARLWDIPAFSSDDAAVEDVLLLADLAEATAGIAVPTAGKADMLNVISAADISAKRQRISALPASDSQLTPLQHFLKWCVLDQTKRTISPFSQMTCADWLENELKTGTLDELRAAMHADPSNSRLAAHFGRRLADFVLEGRADGIEARRAREESAFQTRRALKLTPDSKEIINLRAEVVQLLGLK